MAETPTPLAEIEHGPSKLEQFLEAHQKKLIAVAILIALAVVAYFVYDNKKQTEYQESGNRLVQAEEIGDYQDVVKKAPLSAAAGSAQIMISDFQWEDSQEDSIKTLRDMIDANETHPATPTAQVGLGLKLLEQGKNDEAKEVFERIIGDNSAEYIAPLAMIALGDMAKQAGEIDAAKDWYVQAGGTVPPAQSPPANAFADTASSRLALVNAKPPVKIKPAPKAPTPPPSLPGSLTPPAGNLPNTPGEAPKLELPGTPATPPAAPAAPAVTPPAAPEPAPNDPPAKPANPQGGKNPEDGPR